jgi:hypothetical protein
MGVACGRALRCKSSPCPYADARPRCGFSAAIPNAALQHIIKYILRAIMIFSWVSLVDTCNDAFIKRFA